MRISRSVVAAVAAVLLAAGCSQDPAQDLGSATPTPTPSPSQSGSDGPDEATPTPTRSPSAAAAPDGFSLDDAVPPGRSRMGGTLGAVGEVRVGRHADFDRVVWQFPGRGRPSYSVSYVDRPRADGSGEPVDVRGDAFLLVSTSRVTIPREDTPTPADATAESLAGTVVAEAGSIFGGHEGYGQTFIGVRGEKRPFRVIVLTNPSRLVVDIHAG